MSRPDNPQRITLLLFREDSFFVVLGSCHYDVVVASSEIPKTLPFQILLGRNILDLINLCALGKSKVICVKDPWTERRHRSKQQFPRLI
jgi:hypothetical protein